ncbi:DUF3237 domain-containing protein [Kineococcus sp. DHX-1]|uniref:DUF3237 domain-containing protein n=1 Tax=Kineococcus sp. DHX-1 TaxID=3349638 RepID=UPI0036D30D99
MSTPPPPSLRFAFEARVACDPPLRIGRGEREEVWFTPITGGTVEGPRLRGKVLPHGGDWSVSRANGTELDARYLLQADDGAVIDIRNRGFWVSTPEVEARADAGEPVEETEFYYRTSAQFQTDAPQHEWLTRTVVVGLARPEPGFVCIRFHELA